jgi:hypothetical protein
MVGLAGDRGSSPPLEKGYPENADANFITSSRNPDRMATFPDRHDATGRTSLLYGEAIRTKTSAVQTCTPSPLQGALFQLLH